MKGEFNGQMGNILGKMMGFMDKDPQDLLTDEQINKILTETFKKFDKDNSGKLEQPEFIKAWSFLGLKGAQDEILRAFNKVDTDHSGKVDRREFMTAIKDSVTMFYNQFFVCA